MTIGLKTVYHAVTRWEHKGPKLNDF